MKKMNQILFAAVIAATIGLSTQASAQYNANETDGIAASPRVRQMLNERKSSIITSMTVSKNHGATRLAPTGTQTVLNDGISAAPRTRQLLSEQSRRPAAIPSSTAVASSGYQATGVDGITASPKLRQQLNDRTETVMVAPVK
jgi:hypothetical protein